MTTNIQLQQIKCLFNVYLNKNNNKNNCLKILTITITLTIQYNNIENNDYFS